MALIKCPICDKTIDDGKETCPYCGVVLKNCKPTSADGTNSLKVELENKSHWYQEIYKVKLIGSTIALLATFAMLISSIIVSDITFIIAAVILFVTAIIFFAIYLLAWFRFKNAPIEVTTECEKDRKARESSVGPEEVVCGIAEIITNVIINS